MEFEYFVNVPPHPSAINLRFDIQRLRDLHPTAATSHGFVGRQQISTSEQWFTEHLHVGQVNPAMVMETDPLLVAAYTHDIDAVVMFMFPQEYVTTFGLRRNSMLLSSTCYGRGQNRVAADITPGEGNTGVWRNIWPVIVDFFALGREVISKRRKEVTREEWQRVHDMGRAWIARHGHHGRSGSPCVSNRPAWFWGEDPAILAAQPGTLHDVPIAATGIHVEPQARAFIRRLARSELQTDDAILHYTLVFNEQNKLRCNFAIMHRKELTGDRNYSIKIEKNLALAINRNIAFDLDGQTLRCGGDGKGHEWFEFAPPSDE